MGRGWLVRQDVQHGTARRAKGVLAVVVLSAVAIALGWVVRSLPGGPVFEVLIVAVLLAQKSLVDHVRAVAEGLRRSLGDGRRAVSMIVGRDTRELDEAAVARAAIESAAENLSDGVVAPAFWFLVAGLPGILLYKIVNTADSMIGHRTERHGDFGWAAARLDDVLNWAPARLTACLIALTRLDMGAMQGRYPRRPLHTAPSMRGGRRPRWRTRSASRCRVRAATPAR
jgi:adenosylcobinamide-phosphate synthase